MKEIKKIVESKMNVRFHDCDPFSHLNNSRYIDYMMTARSDQLIENYQFNIYQLAKEKALGWVSAHTQIAYLSPAFVMEEITIQTRLLNFSAKSLLMEAIMWNAEKTELKAIMWSKLVHFNINTQKSYVHDDQLLQFFQQVANPLPQNITFEDRINNLKYKI